MSDSILSMKCPVCGDQILETVLTIHGPVESCPSCGGFFVEEKTIAACSEDKAQCRAALAETEALQLPIDRWCPKCANKLYQGRVQSRQVILTFCPICESLWTDFATLQRFEAPVERALRALMEASASQGGSSILEKAPFRGFQETIDFSAEGTGIGGFLRSLARTLNRWADRMSPGQTIPAAPPVAKPAKPPKKESIFPPPPKLPEMLEEPEVTMAPAAPVPEYKEAPTPLPQEAPAPKPVPAVQKPEKRPSGFSLFRRKENKPVLPDIVRTAPANPPKTQEPRPAPPPPVVEPPPPVIAEPEPIVEAIQPAEPLPIETPPPPEIIPEPAPAPEPAPVQEAPEPDEEAAEARRRLLQGMSGPVIFEETKTPSNGVFSKLITAFKKAGNPAAYKSPKSAPEPVAAPKPEPPKVAPQPEPIAAPKPEPPKVASLPEPVAVPKPKRERGPGLMSKLASAFKPRPKQPSQKLPLPSAGEGGGEGGLPLTGRSPSSGLRPPSPTRGEGKRSKKPSAPWSDRIARWLPLALAILAVAINALRGDDFDTGYTILWALLGWSLGRAARLVLMYPFKPFEELPLNEVAASTRATAWKGLPVVVKGRLVSDGKDSKGPSLTDDSGTELALNRFSRFDILSRLFGVANVGQFPGEHVVVKGWFRRAAVPFVEIAEIQAGSARRKSLVRGLAWASTALVFVVAILLLIASD